MKRPVSNAARSSVHIPVLLQETLEGLCLKAGSVVLDGTLGGGGHAEEILKKIGPKGILIGLDQDEEAINRCRKRLQAFSHQLILAKSNFRNLGEILAQSKVLSVDAVLLDIGVSSYQFDTPERGFSFRFDGSLDMRMDQSGGVTAADLVAGLSEKELADLFFHFGEERKSRTIARWIVEARQAKPIRTTRELAELIESRVPAKVRYGRLHPATRVFQALRIAVNGELEVLEEGIAQALKVLKPGGRVAVITFHSLEDRIVKNFFRAEKEKGNLLLINKKPIVPGEQEIEANDRARSAKLRIAEKRKTEN